MDPCITKEPISHYVSLGLEPLNGFWNLGGDFGSMGKIEAVYSFNKSDFLNKKYLPDVARRCTPQKCGIQQGLGDDQFSCLGR